VAAAVDDIAADRFRKVILSRSIPVDGEIDLIASYQEGRRQNTPARSFLLRLGGLAAAGFSPETIVEVAPDGSFSTQPLAGTRARHGDAATDAALHDELLSDPKEVYEHAVSVQIAQDEVSAVSVPGSVSVAEFMRVVERGSVQHLASRVRGRLRPGATCWDAFARLFPAVTASGLPKAGACAAIARHEDGPRGLYSGAVLTVDGDGGMDAALVLRTLYQQAGRTWLRAGAGIVGQSTPDRELEETCEKLRSVSRFLVLPAATPELTPS
jgi:salicylate synthase